LAPRFVERLPECQVNGQSRAEVGGFLRQGAWFGALSQRLQDEILTRSTIRCFPKGQMFQVEDGEPIGLVAVLEGRALLLRHVDDATPALVHVAAPGFWFGESAVLDGVTLVTAIAQSAVKALVLPKADVDRIVADEPRYYPAFAAIILARYRTLVRFLAEARGLSSDDRLRLRLADLAEMRRLDLAIDGPVVRLDMSQAELGAMVGLSRQKLNARLRALQDEGWVAVSPRRIDVLDADGLRATVLGPGGRGPRES
jgi:CRP-like cAMP-binding protein